MEVLGKPPELPQFSKRDYFKQAYDVLAPDLDDGWRIYCDAIQQVLEETRRGQPPVAPLTGSERQQDSQSEPMPCPLRQKRGPLRKSKTHSHAEACSSACSGAADTQCIR